MVVVLILAVLWAVVLGPPVVRRLMERRSVESIDSFHHSLHLLERTGPKIIQPAYRLDVAPGMALAGANGAPTGNGRPNLVLLKAIDGQSPQGDAEAVVDEASGECYERLGAPLATLAADASRPTLAERDGAYRMERNRRRRRDIVLGLVGAATVTGLLGIVHSLHLLWVLTVLSAIALLAYGALFRYARAMSGTGRARRPASPSRSRRTPDPAWEDVAGAEVGRFADAWDRRELAMAGFPGAWDEPDDGEGTWEVAQATPVARAPRPLATNVVALNPADDADLVYEDEVESRYGVQVYRGAAGAR